MKYMAYIILFVTSLSLSIELYHREYSAALDSLVVVTAWLLILYQTKEIATLRRSNADLRLRPSVQFNRN